MLVLEKDARLVRLVDILAMASEVEDCEVVCCCCMCADDDEAASVASLAAFRLVEDPVNANKLALNGLASTMPPTLYFDDKACCCCWVEEAAMEAEADIDDEALTSLLLLAS